MACNEKLALAVQHFCDSPRDGCAVHVNVEDVQEDADPGLCRAKLPNRDNFAVSRRHDSIPARRSALRIPEEVETKSRKDVQRNPEPWMDEVREGQSKGNTPRCVVKTIRNNAQDFILSWLYRYLSAGAIPGAKQSSTVHYRTLDHAFE